MNITDLKAFDGLDPDIRAALLAQVRDLWTHGSTAIEGNGRLARLLSNVPVLRSGHLPVVIDVQDRKRYIDTLAEYQLRAGQLSPQGGVWPSPDLEGPFMVFCEESYAATRALVSQARSQQAKRAQ